MEPRDQPGCTAFAGDSRIASGSLIEVIKAAKSLAAPDANLVIFDDESGETIELDFRGTSDEVLARLTPGQRPVEGPSRGPGRPKLGVVSREVTLLPRHWTWLNEQPGGASVALRKLVEEAARTRVDIDRARRAREAAYRFLSALSGDRPGYEESLRALFAGDAEHFRSSTEAWPADIRDYATEMAASAFSITQ